MTDAQEEQWCTTQRSLIDQYLREEGFSDPNIGEWPAWYVAPVLAIWAIESNERPGWVGFWAISGDCPMDYTTCTEPRHPRQALRDIALRWQTAAKNWAEGKSAGNFRMGRDGQKEFLAPLLASRAKLMLEWAADDGLWLGLEAGD